MDAPQNTTNCSTCFEKPSPCIGHATNTGVTFMIDANNLSSDHSIHLICIPCFKKLHALHGNAISCPLCRTILTVTPGILAQCAAAPSLSYEPASNHAIPSSHVANETIRGIIGDILGPERVRTETRASERENDERTRVLELERRVLRTSGHASVEELVGSL